MHKLEDEAAASLTERIVRLEGVAMIPDYDVFISYRRASAAHLAQYVREFLAKFGCRVFLDLQEMPAGPFPYALAAVIQNTPNFVPILTPGSLKKGIGSTDYFEQEIGFAFQFRKNIVPLRDEAFGGAEQKPAVARADDLALLHQVVYSKSYPEASLEALDKRLSYTKGNEQMAIGRDTPMVITDHHLWGLAGTNKAVSFLLNERSYTLEYKRTAQPFLLRNEFNILLDGKTIFSRRAFAMKWGKWTWDFYIDGTRCRMDTRFYPADVYFTKIYVGDVLVLDV